MNTKQPTQEERDEDRILQIEEDLCFLRWQISHIEARWCVIIERLKAAKLYTPETVWIDSVIPS